MKLHTLLVLGLALGVMGCAEKEKAAPAQTDDAQSAAETATETGTETATETATEMAAPEQPAAETSEVGNDAFVKHMHLHASQLENLNAALAAGDLDAASTPAYWLSLHERVSGAPDYWQPYVEMMRVAATAVTDASDVEAARAAAEGIAKGCRGCHTAAGVDVPSLVSD
jgi:hypothetical protein